MTQVRVRFAASASAICHENKDDEDDRCAQNYPQNILSIIATLYLSVADTQYMETLAVAMWITKQLMHSRTPTLPSSSKCRQAVARICSCTSACSVAYLIVDLLGEAVAYTAAT